MSRRPKVHLVAGTRPNLVKLAPLLRALEAKGCAHLRLIYTGQHYDKELAGVFFSQLGIPDPDVNLAVGSGSHAQQTSQIMVRYEELLKGEKPDLVVVFGDVNSTLACSLAAAKLCIPVAHVEAGLRSFDRTMPEEINRLLTDAVAELLFATEETAVENLLREGKPPEKIYLAGNVMVDSLLWITSKKKLSPPQKHQPPTPFGVVTVHRPSNVDSPEALKEILQLLKEAASHLPLIFPVHPRTRAAMEKFGLFSEAAEIPGLTLISPQPYLEMIRLLKEASVVITDSGGIQEEASILGIPCLVLRENTERPVTVKLGTCTLIGRNRGLASKHLKEILAGGYKKSSGIPLWDGKAAERIANRICARLGS